MSNQDPAPSIPTYIEAGKKRVIAAAVEWPGWFGLGSDEGAALGALYEVGPHYRRILEWQGLTPPLPVHESDLQVVERLQGNATTDFGAPDIPPSIDLQPIPEAELPRMQAILSACWKAFDQAVANARGKSLRKGPRGGGRELEAILRHVLEAERGYARRIQISQPPAAEAPPADEVGQARQLILAELASKAFLETPGLGPRGGKLWMPRFFVRRAAYHLVDHILEIEKRLE